MRKIDQKKANEFRGFAILWMGIIDENFQMEGKKWNDQKRSKISRINSMKVIEILQNKEIS